jgi:hypothetical protein
VEFKNIILEEKLSKKLNFLLGCPKTMKFRDLQRSLAWEKIFMAVFAFIGQFFFQNNVFKLQEIFSELEIIVFIENGLGSFQPFLILQISDKPEALKRFQKQFLKLDSKPKKSTYTWFSENTLWSLSEAPE